MVNACLWPGKTFWRGWPSTVDLLVLTRLAQLILKLKILFTFLTKQDTLNRSSIVLSLPLHLVFHALTLKMYFGKCICLTLLKLTEMKLLNCERCWTSNEVSVWIILKKVFLSSKRSALNLLWTEPTGLPMRSFNLRVPRCYCERSALASLVSQVLHQK
jgi:hypothetical protein